MTHALSRRLFAFLHDDDGIAAAEYGLIGCFTVVSAITAMDRFGQTVADNIYDIIGAIAVTI